MARLREIGTEPPRHFELQASTVIGRDPSCTIQLRDNLVSRTHCEIRRAEGDRYLLVDLGSTHGTFVGGAKIKEHVLVDGDIIIAGASRLCFELPFKRFGQSAVTISTETAAHALQHTAPVVEAAFLPGDRVGDEAQLRRQYDRLRAAYEVTRAIAAADDVDAVLDGIVVSAFALLAADRVTVLLWDAEKSELVPKLTRLRAGTAADRPVTLSKTLLGDVVKNKTGVILVDAPSDVRYGQAQSVVAGGVRSAMTVPMLHAGELLGVMHMDSLMATHVFHEYDLEIFSSIAGQAALFLKTAKLRGKLQDESKARLYLQRFLSPGVIEEVLGGGKYQLGHGGELREITVLFSDIRGFTALSEKHSDPALIVELLNDYFELMVDVLFRHGGTLDKYVGDELMALFGAPLPMPDAPARAVACGLDMIAALGTFNAARVAAGKFPIDIGIGIHSGVALCGTIGSRKAMQYTAIGDMVNTGARLCSVAKAGQVIASEATVAKLGGAFVGEALAPVSVKGKAEPLKIFAFKR
ncbi:MAG: FHA domain-containing protein [Deltaproteobacteria bacterium]|nr:FHA domain-containing protein [Deltaproteobacteria bacterium]